MEKIVGYQARVLNPHHLAVIYATDKKTGKEDALKLAHLVTDRPDSRLPAVAVPGDEETERHEADHLVKCLKLHEERTAALQQEMAERAKGDKRIGRLETVPGAGPMVAFAFTAFVNAERFQNGVQTGSYLGLAPQVRMSGSPIQYGG
jgi:transposase